MDSGDFAVINGPVLKYGSTKKEYDHIVEGPTGVFCIETKAFGMSEGQSRKGTLLIDAGDKWYICNEGQKREVKSPTAQMTDEKTLLADVLNEFIIDVRPILVLSNNELTVKQNAELSYVVLKADELEGYIRDNKDKVLENDRMFIVKTIDDARVN